MFEPVWSDRKVLFYSPFWTTQWNQFIPLCQANSKITRVFKKNSSCFFVWCLVQLCVSIQYVQNNIWEWIVCCLTILIGCYIQTDDLPFNYNSNHSIWYCAFFCTTGIRVWLKCSSNEILVHPVLTWIKICEFKSRVFVPLLWVLTTTHS